LRRTSDDAATRARERRRLLILCGPSPIIPPRPSVHDPVKPSQQNNFDAMRLLLASAVIVSHSYALGLGHEDTEPLYRLFGVKLFGLHQTFGTLAVGGFFILSGYLITISWLRRRSAVDYFRKRIIRIYPGFVVASALCVFALPLLLDSTQPTYPVGKFAGEVVLLQHSKPAGLFAGNIYPGAVNGSLWSIPYEFWCYIGVAICGAIGLLVRPRLLLAFFVLSLVAAFVSDFWKLNPYVPVVSKLVGQSSYWARLLPFFLAGMVYALYRDRVPLRGWIAMAGLGVFIASALVPSLWAATLPVTMAYGLFYVSLTPRVMYVPAARWGDFSYGTYLYGFPIQQLCVHYAGGSLNPLALLAVSLPLSILAGAISFHVVEKWFLRPTQHARSTRL
jgi:peptidoglycan/LPS O-acetylase OafA/YrhL